MRRKGVKADLGEAISFDSILTILTVLLVLRMIFLIPMVNADKAKLDHARRDSLWIRTSMRLERIPPASDSLSAPYLAAFGLQGCRMEASRDDQGRILLSALASDSTLSLVEHDPQSGHFASLRVQRSSEHPVFRRGTLLWSREERAWFPTSDTADYGQDPSSIAFLARVRSREERR